MRERERERKRERETYPVVTADEVSLVKNKQMHILHVLALLPSPRQRVPLVWRTDDDISLKTRKNNHKVRLQNTTKEWENKDKKAHKTNKRRERRSSISKSPLPQRRHTAHTLASSFRSWLVSPVSITTRFCKWLPNRTFQSSKTCPNKEKDKQAISSEIIQKRKRFLGHSGDDTHPVEGNGHFFPSHRQLYLSSFSDTNAHTHTHTLHCTGPWDPLSSIEVYSCLDSGPETGRL